MEIKALDIGPLRYCIVIAGEDGVCSQCKQVVKPGKLGVMNEDMTAICCWPCIGLGLEEQIAKQTRPLVVL